MGTVHLISGLQGAGKSTYARRLADETGAVRFSIDEWMHQLYGPDLPQPLDVTWIMERVRRCEQRIWATASEVATAGGDVVLDLGFMTVASRTEFADLARASALPVQLHIVDAPRDLRRERVLARNAARGETFAFEVTPGMFDFMESRFERPTASERSESIVSTFE